MLTIAISRTGLPGGLGPLVLSAEDDANPLGITAYSSPGRIGRVTYLPDEPDIHGSIPQAGSLQQGVISFGVLATAASESVMRSLIGPLEQALGQLNYTVTETIGDAAPRVYPAVMGSIELANNAGRTYEDLRDSDPVYAVTIPVYPIPS